mmetsp:Transcript_67419/g.190817  ORF Transcript_67419/g.190817 Transcript_67419/m.190817 type:complete len:253 (-) Transcript_67419:1199-1957(-)
MDGLRQGTIAAHVVQGAHGRAPQDPVVLGLHVLLLQQGRVQSPLGAGYQGQVLRVEVGDQPEHFGPHHLGLPDPRLHDVGHGDVTDAGVQLGAGRIPVHDGLDRGFVLVAGHSYVIPDRLPQRWSLGDALVEGRVTLSAVLFLVGRIDGRGRLDDHLCVSWTICCVYGHGPHEQDLEGHPGLENVPLTEVVQAPGDDPAHAVDDSVSDRCDRARRVEAWHRFGDREPLGRMRLVCARQLGISRIHLGPRVGN